MKRWSNIKSGLAETVHERCMHEDADTLPNHLRNHWQLNPEVDFLNHGSFGATPRVVLEAQRAWIEQLERDPIEFLAPERTLLPKLNEVRETIGQLVSGDPLDIAFVRNATEGVNAVLRSFPFSQGDEVVVTNHGYNACNNAVKFAAERIGAVVKVADIPFPIQSPLEVIDAIESTLTNRSRLLLVDHVTSPTGLVLPVQEIIDLAHRQGVRVMVDGAHAPGMLPVDLRQLGADYYTANHHKWLCAPKTSGFLYVAKQWQSEVRPTSISHGANTDTYGPSKFLAEFNWVGTYDPTPILAVPTAISFLSGLNPDGMTRLMEDNRTLALDGRDRLMQALKISPPAPQQMIGSLAAIPLSTDALSSTVETKSLQRSLFVRHRIEVPIFELHGRLPCLRISAQAYNSIEQYDRLAEALSAELSRFN